MGKYEMTRAGKRCIFLDRDGVLNQPLVRGGRPFPPERVEAFQLYDDAPACCARLKEAGFLLVVVTNQPDVGRGKQSRTIVEAINKKLSDAIPLFDRIEVCFHAGAEYGEPCTCRKPRPGMLLRAAKVLGIDLTTSYLIGDRWRDVDCAHAAGCRAIFIDRGYVERLRQPPDVTVSTFEAAVTAILRTFGRAPCFPAGTAH
jgi:D-glycero-D-manno-heptose 1,7-bisphosphate phosphatase